MSRPQRGSLKQRLNAVGVIDLLSTFLAAVGLVGGAFGAIIVYVLAVGFALLLIVLSSSRTAVRTQQERQAGEGALPRATVLAAVAAASIHVGSSFGISISAALLILLAAEIAAARVSHAAIPFAAHLPGVEVRSTSALSVELIYWIHLACLPFAAATFTSWYMGVIALIGILITACLSAVAVIDGAMRLRARRRADADLNTLLVSYAPVFAVYWDAEPGTGYQLAMWLPYLDRLAERYIVIVRNERSFSEAASLATQPTLLRTAMEDLDDVVVPTLRGVFYVNNAARNTNMVRFPRLVHIQLNHGDSEKTPSYNPVVRMYDKNFVAGQAAIDRFSTHGVPTAPNFFVIVGRPQVESITVGPRDDQTAPAPRILYAPTWSGFNSDSRYSSLTLGSAIVSKLLSRGFAVIFRPHPYTNRSPKLRREAERIRQMLAEHQRSTYIPQLWGEEAESKMSLYQCFNNADALISDVSSVVSDFLYSTKPFGVMAMNGSADQLERDLPMARAGYPIAADLSNLGDALDSMMTSDPRRTVREQFKDYYLGAFTGDRYADVFVAAARHHLGMY